MQLVRVFSVGMMSWILGTPCEDKSFRELKKRFFNTICLCNFAFSTLMKIKLQVSISK